MKGSWILNFKILAAILAAKTAKIHTYQYKNWSTWLILLKFWYVVEINEEILDTEFKNFGGDFRGENGENSHISI